MRTSIPNASVPLVDRSGRPSSALMEMIPALSARDAVVDRLGRPTPMFLKHVGAVAEKALPNATVPIVNLNGTPTRVMTALLMSIAMEAS